MKTEASLKSRLQRLGYDYCKVNARDRRESVFARQGATYKTFPIAGSGPRNYFKTREQVERYCTEVEQIRAFQA